MSQTQQQGQTQTFESRPSRGAYRTLYPVLCSDIYPGTRFLPARLAWLHSLAAGSFIALIADVEAAGGELAVSDMFRTTAMQSELHLRKPGLANPPGTSFHEAGLAVDIDQEVLNMPLFTFQSLARARGWRSIPNESWHFEFGPEGEFGQLHPCFAGARLSTVIAGAQLAHTELMGQIHV